MYESILTTTYSEAIKKFKKVDGINSIRKVLTFRNDSTFGGYSDKSDIIVYYDVISNSTPLLVIERIKIKNVRMIQLKRIIKNLNKELEGYTASTNVSNKKYVDIIIVKFNIYKRLSEG